MDPHLALFIIIFGVAACAWVNVRRIPSHTIDNYTPAVRNPMAGMVFKSGEALFDYLCKFSPWSTNPLRMTAALVREAIPYPSDPKLQLVFLLLPDAPAPTEASAITSGVGPKLLPGDLVGFYQNPNPPDPRYIVGVIPVVLEPRYNDNGIAAKIFFSNGEAFIHGLSLP